MRLNEARVRPFPGLTLAGIGVVAAFMAFGVYVQWRDEARAVRGRVQEAADAVSSRTGETDIERLARLAGLSKLLALNIVVETDEGGPTIRGREAVVALASQLSAAAGPQTVTLSDIEVAINDVKTLATVTAVAHVSSPSASAPTKTYDGQVIHLELIQEDVGLPWVISRVRPEPPLDR